MNPPVVIVCFLGLLLTSAIGIYVFTQLVDTLPDCPTLSVRECVFSQGSVNLEVFSPSPAESPTGLRFSLLQENEAIIIDKPFLKLNVSMYATTLTDPRVFNLSSVTVSFIPSDNAFCTSEPSLPLSCSPSRLRVVPISTSSSSGGGGGSSSGGSSGGGSSSGGGDPSPQCSDGVDNDGDGLTDYPADTGCANAGDNSELDVVSLNNPPRTVLNATPSKGIAPFTVVFDASRSSDVEDTSLAYAWNITTGSGSVTSTVVSFSQLFSIPGIFPVSLTVTDSGGLSATQSASIEVCSSGISTCNQAPIARFVASPLTGVAPLTVAFDASFSSDDFGIALYEWNFGDATPLINASDASVVQHTFNAGTYNVTLRVTDTFGVASLFSTIIIVNPLPECLDALDNDNDGAIDSQDYACTSGGTTENAFLTECQDGLDNDNNGAADYPSDTGCNSTQDITEYTLPIVINTTPRWGLLNNGLPIATSLWGVPSTVVDSEGNLFYVYTDPVTSSVYATRYHNATGNWERLTNSGWSSDVLESPRSLGTSGFSEVGFMLGSDFHNSSLLFGLDSGIMKTGVDRFDVHTNNFNVKIDPFAGSLVRWYNGSTYSPYNAQSMIWNHLGSKGALGRGTAGMLFVKHIGFGWAKTNFSAAWYDASRDAWGIWYNGVWNYSLGIAWFTNSPVPFLVGGESPDSFVSPWGLDAAITVITESDTFLIIYPVLRGGTHALRAALYNSTSQQWLTWDNQWNSNYATQRDIITSSSGYALQMPLTTPFFFAQGEVFLPFMDDTQTWKLLVYTPSTMSFRTITSPFSTAFNLALASDARGVPWIAYFNDNSDLYLVNYTHGSFSNPVLISTEFPTSNYIFGFTFKDGTVPVISFGTNNAIGPGFFYAISNLNSPGWSSQSFIEPSVRSITPPLSLSYGEQHTQWTPLINVTVLNRNGVLRSFYSSYGPVRCGHMTFDSEGWLYCPQAAFTSVLIFPHDYVPAIPIGSALEETARQWGNFWEYQYFPSSVSVDNIRNKTYVVETSYWGGGSEAFPSGSVKVWDKDKKFEFVVNATIYEKFNQTYMPATLLLNNRRFNRPSDTAIDEERGILYVVESSAHRIDRFDIINLQNGLPRYLSSFGSEGTGNGQFRLPQGIDTDSAGNIYVVDTDNSRIQKFDSTGVFVGSWGGWGTASGQFIYPQGIAVDKPLHYVYVTDPYNSRVQIFSENGDFVYAFGASNILNQSNFTGVVGVAVHNNTLALSSSDIISPLNGQIQIFSMHLP
jgi:PKD repeat protein